MSTAQEILAAGGFQNADALVRAANDTGLPLGIAAALVAKESMGANVYGHDAGGALSGGGTVTQDNFTNQFMPIIRAGGTSNGVGPTQITYAGYFTQNPDVAWWDPYTNMCFGFTLMKGYLAGDYGDPDLVAAGSRYNSGSATGAPEYGTTFRDLATEWTNRLQGSDTNSTTNSTIQEEDMDANQAAQLAKISAWIDQANNEQSLGKITNLHRDLVDPKTRADGHVMTVGGAIPYMDQRLEKVEGLLTGYSIPYEGAQTGNTDIVKEVAWNKQNFSDVRAKLDALATAVAALHAAGGTVAGSDLALTEDDLKATIAATLNDWLTKATAANTATETK